MRIDNFRTFYETVNIEYLRNFTNFKLGASPQMECWNYSMRLTKRKAAKSIVIPINCSIVGWVKRDIGTIFVGFADLNTPQQFEIETKLANPTCLIADPRLNPTYDLCLKVSALEYWSIGVLKKRHQSFRHCSNTPVLHYSEIN